MTPLRALSIGCALAAARRWPVLGAVGGLLGVEALAGELAALATSERLSALAWGSSSAIATGAGASLGARDAAHPLALSLACLAAALFFAQHPEAYALTSALCCACALALLVASTAPHDLGRLSAMLLLAGNLAGCVLIGTIGMHKAYSADLVLWSNNITHLSIAGLALWTMRAR